MARKEHKVMHYEDRKKLEEMGRAGCRVVEMAAAIGVHRSTIYKEYARTGFYPDNYNADEAQKRT